MNNDTINLTERRMADLPTPAEGRQAWTRDGRSPLSVLVTATGVRSFYVQRRVGGRPVRVRIGRWPNVTVEQARSLAEVEIGRMAGGTDPRAQRDATRRAANAKAYTVSQTIQDYIDDAGRGVGREKPLKPSTLAGYRHVHSRSLTGLDKLPLAELGGMHLDKLRRSGTASTANAAIRLLRAAVNHAVGRDLLARSPLEGRKRLVAATRARDTYIPEADLGRFLLALRALQDDAAEGEPIPVGRQIGGDALMLMTLYGLRKSEALTLRVSAVDLDAGTLTIASNKADRPLVLPITPAAEAVIRRRFDLTWALGSPFLFPSVGNRTSGAGHLAEPRHAIRDVTRATGLTFTPHDLRRTFVSLASRHLPYAMLKNVINHAATDKGDVTLTHYVRTSADDMRRPLTALHEHMNGLTAEAQGIRLATRRGASEDVA